LTQSLFSSRAAIVLAATLAFALVLFDQAVLNDGDTYWHIAAGRWMLENASILRIDPFSYTFMGHPWHTHEWLAECAMASAYIFLGGWSGVVLLFGLAAALTAGLLAYHLSRKLHGIALGLTLLLGLSCVAGSLLARPHLLALPLLELWTASLLIAREKHRAPPWLLLPVMALWANLHASFLIGLALAFAFALEAVLEDADYTKALRSWGIFLALAILAALITPYGIDGLIFPFKLMAMPALQMIDEWAPTNFQHFQPLAVALAVALYALVTRGVTIKSLRVLVLLGLLYLALLHVRHHMLIGIIGSLILAEPLAQGAPVGKPRLGWLAGAALALLLIGLGTARFLIPLTRDDGEATPQTAFAHVPDDIAKAPVLNDYAFGGYLIFNGVRPYIDSRAELYGEKFIVHYASMVRPDKQALADTLPKEKVRWTIFAPDNPAVGAMDEMAGWHRLYADHWAVVHVRDGEP
jgi:hypothetical protein